MYKNTIPVKGNGKPSSRPETGKSHLYTDRRDKLNYLQNPILSECETDENGFFRYPEYKSTIDKRINKTTNNYAAIFR